MKKTLYWIFIASMVIVLILVIAGVIPTLYDPNQVSAPTANPQETIDVSGIIGQM